MFGKCKVCVEKDKTIALLQEQVSFLRDLARPKVNNSLLTVNEYEANGVLDVADQQITIETRDKQQERLTDEELAEREALLGGTY